MQQLEPLENLRDAINSHDPDKVAACFTADYDGELPQHPSRSFVGNDGVRQNWTALLTRIPDLHAEILRNSVSGDETWTEWEMHGTTTDGEAAVMRGPVISWHRDGLIARTRFYVDPVDA